MSFSLKDAKVLGTVSTVKRDVFTELLQKNGFARQVDAATHGYELYLFKANNWLYVRAYREHYSIHLFSDGDTYVAKKNEYDQHSQQKEGFMMNNILRNI